MKVKEIRALVKEFSQSLTSKEKDEWWGTERGVWNDISGKFLMWCERNRKRIENPPGNSSKSEV